MAWLLSFRSPLFWLLVALLSLAWLIFCPRSETVLQLSVNSKVIIGSVNGADLALDSSKITAPLTGTVALYTAPPETSQYYQAGEPNGPFAFLGALGEAIQQARPGASWRVLASSNSAGNTTPLADLPSAPRHLDAGQIGGRVASGFVIGAAAGPQYAFVVRPERR